jgi:hypothetical protein
LARFTSFDVPRIFVSELSQNERIHDSHRPSRVACGSSPGYRNLVQHEVDRSGNPSGEQSNRCGDDPSATRGSAGLPHLAHHRVAGAPR